MEPTPTATGTALFAAIGLSALLAAAPARAQTGPGNALWVQTTSGQYVSVTLASSLANNYTFNAWVYLSQGGIEYGTRMAIAQSPAAVAATARWSTAQRSCFPVSPLFRGSPLPPPPAPAMPARPSMARSIPAT